MNIIRLMSFVYALLQMLAMLVILLAGKKHSRRRRRKIRMIMPLWGATVWVFLAAVIGFSWYEAINIFSFFFIMKISIGRDNQAMFQ